MRRAARALGRDRRGGAVVEFALVVPVMLALTLGLSELAYQLYVQSVLTGAVQKAGRDAGIEGGAGQTAAIDALVRQQVDAVVAKASYASTRDAFASYDAMAGEPFTDSRYPDPATGAYDGKCDHGEPYVDQNGNGRYDLDLGTGGQGGANAIARYTMAVTYTRLFPYVPLPWGNTVTLSATTLLKNQPYTSQSANVGTDVRTCA